MRALRPGVASRDRKNALRWAVAATAAILRPPTHSRSSMRRPVASAALAVAAFVSAACTHTAAHVEADQHSATSQALAQNSPASHAQDWTDPNPPVSTNGLQYIDSGKYLVGEQTASQLRPGGRYSAQGDVIFCRDADCKPGIGQIQEFWPNGGPGNAVEFTVDCDVYAVILLYFPHGKLIPGKPKLEFEGRPLKC